MTGEGTCPLADRWAAVHDRARRWEPPAVPTVVVVPHPDDEVLSTGGLIIRQRNRGIDVTVLAVTDGGACYPDRVDPDRLAALRAAEQAEALAVLGVPAADVVRLGIPDGAVPADEDALVDAIVAHLPDGALLVAPWTRDHHSDHEACGRAAVAATRARPDVTLVQGVFWGWHHGTPDDLADRDVLGLELTPSAAARRWQAMACHASQVGTAVVEQPLLDEAALEPLGWRVEHLLEGPGRG